MCFTRLGCLPANSRRDVKLLIHVSIMKMYPTQSSNPNDQVGSIVDPPLDINSVVQSFQNELSVGSYQSNQQQSQRVCHIQSYDFCFTT